jgi:glycine/D-amino acid oxidase-like deaminating enzyme/nitrite reductase/ring-hydroxylating ferredoxin subunit
MSEAHSMKTSGETDAVWVHTEPYSNRPGFPKLNEDRETDVCVIGAGISGISTAYELVSRGKKVILIEARDVLSGETGRTSGHLSSSLDDPYTEIAKKHGESGAKVAAESHQWALKRVGEISRELGIECEYRVIPDYEISQYEKGNSKHEDEMRQLKEDLEKASKLGLRTSYREGYAIKGWDGKVDQRDVAVWEEQATFHPTKYLVGLLKWLAKQPNFECYTRTRMMSIQEEGLLHKKVTIGTLDGQTITCKDAVEATCIPLQKLSIVAQLEYHRTYCIAIRVPKGSIEDCLINDQADPYHYIRFTACDDKDDYLVIGGYDHKVGQEDETGRFEKLEKWVRDRFTRAGSVDYKWSGQILDSTDLVAYIGLNQGKSHTYIMTGDTGHGLTHGVIAGRLIADQITGIENPWSKLYSPKRLPPLSTLPSMLAHDVQINLQYKRFLQSDISDIEDLKPGSGGVLNKNPTKPLAVYKDDEGKVHQFSAMCPHLQGVVCWNPVERSFDCPVHGSRFSKEGIQFMGPAKAGLSPADGAGESAQLQAQKS